MATSDAVTNLIAARDANAAQIAAVLSSTNPTVNVGERTVSKAEWYRVLMEIQKDLNEQIAKLQPYSVVSQVL